MWMDSRTIQRSELAGSWWSIILQNLRIQNLACNATIKILCHKRVRCWQVSQLLVGIGKCRPPLQMSQQRTYPTTLRFHHRIRTMDGTQQQHTSRTLLLDPALHMPYAKPTIILTCRESIYLLEFDTERLLAADSSDTQQYWIVAMEAALAAKNNMQHSQKTRNTHRFHSRWKASHSITQIRERH